MEPMRIQDRSDYPCGCCKTPCTGMGCKLWQDCFKRSWQDTKFAIEEVRSFEGTRKTHTEGR